MKEEDIKLFRFSLPDVEDCLYLYSISSKERDLRRAFGYQDHGGMKWEVYERLAREGQIELITSIDQVPGGIPGVQVPYWERNGERDCIPYSSDDVEGFGDYGYDKTIGDYFRRQESEAD